MNSPSTQTTPASMPAAMEGTTLPTEIQQHLGNLLKASYNDVLTAPIPDRFMQLLEQLEQSGRPAMADATSAEAGHDR